MSDTSANIVRPQRWDVPFDAEMRPEDVDRILSIEPFSRIEADRFPSNTPLRDILLNDTGLRRFEKNQVIVREGDYGNSAFFIIRGSVVATLGKDAISSERLGRRQAKKGNFVDALRRLWNNPVYPEVRDISRYQKDAAGSRAQGSRSDDAGTIFLHDLPVILKGGTATLRAGMFFGEIAALGRTPRTSTIIASEDCELLEIRWQGLRELRLRAPEIKKFVDGNYRKYSLENHLRETKYFKDLSPEELKAVADQTRFETYGSFDWQTSYKKNKDTPPEQRMKEEPVIAEEGQYANGLILIRAGFARMSQRYNQGERTESYLARGQMFGFEEIAHNWARQESTPLQYTLRALGYVDVLVVPTAVVEQYILPKIPPESLPPPVVATPADEKTRPSGGLSTDVLEFLVDHRFINGRAAMVMDLDRCTRCDDCVRACAAGHDNNPRFVRHGQQHGRYMIANACMHCLDPVCMIGCPTGAIHRSALGGEVIINDTTCIGCSTCANSCPYNNIQIVEIMKQSGEPVLDVEGRAVVKATKCDLCVEHAAGPACVRACPHDALTRVNMQETSVLARWLQR